MPEGCDFQNWMSKTNMSRKKSRQKNGQKGFLNIFGSHK